MTEELPTTFTSIVSSTATATVSFAGTPSVVGYLQQYTPVKPPDNHAIYAFVGRIASDWAHVEHLFDEIIWHLLGGLIQLGALASQLKCLVCTRVVRRLLPC